MWAFKVLSCRKALTMRSLPTTRLGIQCERTLARKLTPHQQELMARGLPKKQQLAGVEHVVVVASGKGGVGKSTVSANLAVSLAQQGKRVGLLDCDIFGPSIPLLMNLHSEPLVDKSNRMLPPINYGVKCISLGMLTPQSDAVIWRGPLVMSAIQRLLKGTDWGSLDVLVVDTPPGTGDVHLSLAQNVPISGAILVSTPHAAAMEVTLRGMQMYRKLNIPILGLVENMRYIICSNCKHRSQLFNTSTSQFLEKAKTELLVSLPIDANISECCENGTPYVAKFSKSEYTQHFHDLANTIMKKLEQSKEKTLE